MKHIKYFPLNEDNNQHFKFERVEELKYLSDNHNFEKSEIDDISELEGEIISEIKYDGESICFKMYDYDERDIYYIFHHVQDCSEFVWLDDISGDLEDLLYTPLLKVEEKISDNGSKTRTDTSLDESATWTFYTFATINGYVDIRWIGTSNGYYSEEVHIDKLISLY